MAIHLPDHNLVIWEIPKTGTQYIRESLQVMSVEWYAMVPCRGQQEAPRHATPDQFDVPDGCRRVAIVRSPERWLWSFWSFHTHGGESLEIQDKFPGIAYPHRWLVELLTLDYSEWVSRVIMSGKLPEYLSQWPAAADVVVRNEELRPRLRRITGLDWPADRVNASPRQSLPLSDGQRVTLRLHACEVYRRYYGWTR